VTEHQFIHVDWSSHVEEITRLFRERGINFDLSS
jgi:hypothetical protein